MFNDFQFIVHEGMCAALIQTFAVKWSGRNGMKTETVNVSMAGGNTHWLPGNLQSLSNLFVCCFLSASAASCTPSLHVQFCLFYLFVLLILIRV